MISGDIKWNIGMKRSMRCTPARDHRIYLTSLKMQWIFTVRCYVAKCQINLLLHSTEIKFLNNVPLPVFIIFIFFFVFVSTFASCHSEEDNKWNGSVNPITYEWYYDLNLFLTFPFNRLQNINLKFWPNSFELNFCLAAIRTLQAIKALWWDVNIVIYPGF